MKSNLEKIFLLDIQWALKYTNWLKDDTEHIDPIDNNSLFA